MLGRERVSIQPRSGWIDNVGKREKRRRVRLNSKVLQVLQGDPLTLAAGSALLGKRGPYTTRGTGYFLQKLGRWF